MDALIHMTDYSDPASKLYRYRNPLGLRVFCVHGRGMGLCEMCPKGQPQISRAWHSKLYDHQSGLRIFKNLHDGYAAAIFDLWLKCSGNSHARVGPRSTLSELCIAYAMPGSRAADPVAKFLRKAIGDETIRPETQIGIFTEWIAGWERAPGGNWIIVKSENRNAKIENGGQKNDTQTAAAAR